MKKVNVLLVHSSYLPSTMWYGFFQNNPKHHPWCRPIDWELDPVIQILLLCLSITLLHDFDYLMVSPITQLLGLQLRVNQRPLYGMEPMIFWSPLEKDLVPLKIGLSLSLACKIFRDLDPDGWLVRISSGWTLPDVHEITGVGWEEKMRSC